MAYFLTAVRKHNPANMKAIITIIALCVTANCFAQQKTITEKDLAPVNRTVSLGMDGAAQVIHLDAKDDDGVAWIKGTQFTEGTIEVDIKGKDVLQHSFVGIAFHGADNKTFEVIYFRPFNFRASDDVRKSHAVQYVALPGYDWEKLRTEHPGQYEKPVEPAPEPNEWFHARIEIQSNIVKVFVNGNATPSLTVQELVHTNGKMIGYWVGNTSDGNWKNIKISPANH
ncbi:family 16 glycoside hydrolase [Mucilaginibacter sp.]|uniref:family 16 glycoside hydrolase n=1 Tax=Mucilaginibacter sp. TaxID=1882438 RepID=UPI002B52EDF8|nr:family 16 glycoside hydrolase [Mucilaginibacter sp.]HTI61311.1 family 16 glycoside hydrolase [Mucilaginibacter sp.]